MIKYVSSSDTAFMNIVTFVNVGSYELLETFSMLILLNSNLSSGS